MLPITRDNHDGPPLRVLIANRSEIALRLLRSYALHRSPPIETVVIYTDDDCNSLHVREADVAVPLPGHGPKAYLDAPRIVDIAKHHHCWAVAPGYGFLSEDASFVRLLEEKGIVFLGPTSDQLRRLGDKVEARALARQLEVPILEASEGSESGSVSSLEAIQRFARQLSAGSKVILKAAAGGGGRGIRVVELGPDSAANDASIESNFNACQREGRLSFGDDRIYAERFLASAKHVEVQILGDGHGAACHFWDRECSLQRRNQKLVEIAPSPSISERLREDLIESALTMARHLRYRSLATFEFLISHDGSFYFMEANPRIQVEHTVTEQITGYDLAALQLRIGLGQSIEQLGLAQGPPRPRTTSIQLRINAESIQPEGTARPEVGELTALQLPTGPNVRVDTAAHGPSHLYGRYSVSPLFDSLLAKVIVTAPDYPSALRLAERALEATEVCGCKTNRQLLRALVQHPVVRTSEATTSTVQDLYEELYRVATEWQQREEEAAGARRQASDADAADVQRQAPPPNGTEAVAVPITGALVELKVSAGNSVVAGAELGIIEAMKMEHVVRAARAGRIHTILAKQGATVAAGQTLLFLEPADGSDPADGATTLAAAATEEELEAVRPELRELQERRHTSADAFRTSAVQKRRAKGYLSPREVLALLIDRGSMREYGDLVVAAQRRRHSLQHLVERTQGDGIITGWATVDSRAVAVAMGDYLVLAGTQGYFHHVKLDRLFESVLENAEPHPLVLFAEGGGGRPGDTDVAVVAGLNTPSFGLLAKIRARGIPTVGVANGYVFAGNAALLGVCDVVIATRGGDRTLAETGRRGVTSIGMGGAAMIEGGGLGRFTSDEIGPAEVHWRNGGIDVLVDTEAEAVEATKKVLSFFTRPRLERGAWRCSADQRLLRLVVPDAQHRKRSYDMYALLDVALDDGSFLELGRGWGSSVITGLARIEGRTVGIVASQSSSPLSGAIDGSSALKTTRFVRYLARVGVSHIVTMCDTPGFMVGPQAEAAATAGGSFRIFGDLFAAFEEFQTRGGKVVGMVVRNAYGLGAQALLGGSTRNATCVAWPTAAFGAMGLEGAVRLGRKAQLEKLEEPERSKREKEWIEQLYHSGRGVGMAMAAEIDTVIDPCETRAWVASVLDRLGRGARL
ncbi:hypothetical protein ACQY0O_004010 [Thecaphora frezii]